MVIIRINLQVKYTKRCLPRTVCLCFVCPYIYIPSMIDIDLICDCEDKSHKVNSLSCQTYTSLLMWKIFLINILCSKRTLPTVLEMEPKWAVSVGANQVIMEENVNARGEISRVC